jgi:UrcA family protein
MNTPHASRDGQSRFYVVCLATVLLASAASFTSAAPLEKFDAAPSVKVHFGDLDLTKPAGVDTLYRRIQQAARMVCRDSASPYEIGRARVFRKCYDTAIDTAVSDVSAPLLTARHDGNKSKRTAARR